MLDLIPTRTIQDIRDLEPCYDPVTGIDESGFRFNAGYLSEDWQGTALDILALDECPAQDRLWVICFADWLHSAKIRRLWAVWCVRQALALLDKPDPYSVAACVTARRYAYGEATVEELETARLEGVAAAVIAVANSLNNPLDTLAHDVAKLMIYNAAWSTAWNTARLTVGNAVWEIASLATQAAESLASTATKSDVRAAAWAAQVTQLRRLIVAELKEQSNELF